MKKFKEVSINLKEDETNNFELDGIKKILLSKVDQQGLIDIEDVNDVLRNYDLNDDDFTELTNFFIQKGIDISYDDEEESHEDDSQYDEELDEPFDEECYEDEMSFYDNNENPKKVYERIRDSENALKIKKGQWIFLQVTEFGGLDYVWGGTYSYKAGLLVNIDEQNKTFRIGLMIGNGDSSPASPIPCYLNGKDSIDFISKWVSKTESNVTYALESFTKDDYFLLEKQIKKQFSPKVKNVHAVLDDGTLYYDKIMPEEIELIENIDKSRLNCLLPKRLDLHKDMTAIWLSCEAGATSREERFAWTDFSMLIWALSKLF